MVRPWGPTGPAPEVMWLNRPPILEPERRSFIQAVASYFADEVILFSQATPALTPAQPFGAQQRAVLARRAIRRALLDLGFLSTRRTVD
jgi:hypothetical protein